MGVLDSCVVVEFHLVVYLVVGVALSLLYGIETHVGVALLVLPVLQEALTELVHLPDQF